MKKKHIRSKIYEKNQNLKHIRWRYIDESPDKFGIQKYNRLTDKSIWNIITKGEYYKLKKNGYMALTKQGRRIIKDQIQDEVL